MASHKILTRKGKICKICHTRYFFEYIYNDCFECNNINCITVEENSFIRKFKEK